MREGRHYRAQSQDGSVSSHQLTSILWPQGLLELVNDCLILLWRHKLAVNHPSQDLHGVRVKFTVQSYKEPLTWAAFTLTSTCRSFRHSSTSEITSRLMESLSATLGLRSMMKLLKMTAWRKSRLESLVFQDCEVRV